MPCGPGVLWELNKDGKSFWKKSLCYGTSFEELQFMMLLQFHDPRFVGADGDIVQIEHNYFRGQRKISGYDVDGYAEVDGRKIIIEFNGCWFHKPCPHKYCKQHAGYNENNKDSTGQLYQWYTKEQDLMNWAKENDADLLVMWECQVDFKKYRGLETPFMPRCLNLNEVNNNDVISSMIREDKFFGFVLCDLSTSDKIKEKYKTLNFPPIVRRQEITEELLSDYQIEMLRLSNRKLPITTVINAWEGTRLLMFTPYLKFLLKIGVKITKVHQIIQYSPGKCFSSFINKCVKGRIDAGADKTKANTFKIAMNSSYGKLLENVSKYTETKVKRFQDIKRKWLRNKILSISEIGDEDNDIMEVVSRKNKIKDDKLPHCGVAVLQWSKFLLMKFIYWLEEMLIKGSFKICYLGDLLNFDIK